MRLLVAALMCAFSLNARAAELQKLPVAGASRDLIIMTGVIELGDEVLFRQMAEGSRDAVIVLNSEGGSVWAALEIGRAIRQNGFSTAVAPDALCASACALTWLAGSSRFGAPSSHIGFHAAYTIANGAASESGVGNALVGAYLNQLGLSQDAIVFVTSAPPEGMEWLTPDKAREIGVGFEDVSPQTVGIADVPAAVAPRSDDPFSTVTGFYDALSAADGEAASALVIPEKRGIGPFNERAIHAFFGQLMEPLKLRSVSVQSDALVAVTYRYTRANGEVCQGEAKVELTRKFGRNLISRIKALKGC